MAISKITQQGLAGVDATCNNVAFGENALSSVTSGNRNTAIGDDSMCLTTTGLNNTAVGKNAIKKNTSGCNNVAVGDGALVDNTTASNNTAVGYNSLLANTTGAQNVALGRAALISNTTASNNTSVGYHSSYQNTTGTNNTAVGWSALNANTTGNSNVALGVQALDAISTANQNTAVGENALSSLNGTGNTNNTAVGRAAGFSITSGAFNTLIGVGCHNEGAGYQITSGSYNSILGGFNGNQGGLDIRTANYNIVLSDGVGNPRLFIDGGGVVNIGKFDSNIATAGHMFEPSGIAAFTRNGDVPLAVNRNTGDGDLILFRQDNNNEGSISVSGTTVSYNGGHLARWSQLADNTRDESIVKGTVMSNLDQMAEWTHEGVTEDNEQLNCMKVSDVEGDADVAGVFVNWDNDDDIYTNDMNVAMTGDMVIRIAQGTTVARGDLLMSAGDGTAKPQGDDIVRSKTIAKVTSTHVSHTYDDGSYLVPCVLMAC